MKTDSKTLQRVYSYSFASIYPLYLKKVERKGRTKKEVDQVIHWLTGYDQKAVKAHISKKTDLQTFYAKARMSEF